MGVANSVKGVWLHALYDIIGIMILLAGLFASARMGIFQVS